MNRKGQALVEFVIILPVILALLFVSIDFGKIIYSKIRLENITNDVVNMYKVGNSDEKINKFIKNNDPYAKYKVEKKNNYLTFTLYSKVYITTPGLNIVLDNPYKINNKRVVYYAK